MVARRAKPAPVVFAAALASGWLGAAAGAPAAAAVAAQSGPRPLTAAERQAVQLAAEYMIGGAPAWLDQLSRGSALRRLGREAALAEIEVRAGPPAGARWEMRTTPADFARHGAVWSIDFPSGVDETLQLDLVEEGGGWKIDSLRISAEPDPDALVPVRDSGDRAPSESTAESRSERAASASSDDLARKSSDPAMGAASRPFGIWRLVIPAAAGAAGLALLVSAVLLRRRPVPAAPPPPSRGGAGVAYRRGPAASLALQAMIVAGGVALLAVALFGLWRGLEQARAATRQTAAAATGRSAASSAGELRPLLGLRRALTQAGGGETGATPEVAGAAPAEGSAGSVALLWRAQRRLLAATDLDGAEAILRRFPVPGRLPLAELLRARLGLLRLREMDAGTAYERALTIGVRHEGLLLEAAAALYILGFENHGKSYLRQLRSLGARSAESYYALAETAVADNQMHDAYENFRLGWRLQPVERGEILGQPLTAYLLIDREVRSLLMLGQVAEPAPACAGAGSRALALPPGVGARLLGEVLRLSGGSAEVTVPGACDLAPAGTPVESAADWNRRREAAALARLPELMASARSPGALAQPALRRQTEEAALALAEHDRWREIVELTESLAQAGSILPPHLVRLRAAALQRTARRDEARQLLIRLAMGDKAAHRPDPGGLYQLAGLMASAGDFDAAIRLVVKANSELPTPARNERVLQLQMEKRLAASAAQWKSAHFDIRYPGVRGQSFATEVARILEAERLRLQKWIPGDAGGELVEVHLLPYEDFEIAYSQGGFVLGMFDELIRVPLGSVRRFNPFVVSILSHELAHALIARRTGGMAPRWFHEGLARHIQMVQDHVNPIPEYRAHGLLLSFPLIEPALEGFASPEWTSAAYDEAQWTMHYIETRYGVAGIHRLLDAYRAGKTTEEALASAFGTGLERFDHEVWDWCTTKAPSAWVPALVHYESDENADEGPTRTRHH
ncbi:MAG TPA: hypothetical protein VHR45_12415 [Thermoanaerobaculia bacterium]|nr:hypothetical protein [Thermoanaerobaculia bacterium]